MLEPQWSRFSYSTIALPCTNGHFEVDWDTVHTVLYSKHLMHHERGSVFIFTIDPGFVSVTTSMLAHLQRQDGGRGALVYQEMAVYSNAYEVGQQDRKSVV